MWFHEQLGQLCLRSPADTREGFILCSFQVGAMLMCNCNHPAAYLKQFGSRIDDRAGSSGALAYSKHGRFMDREWLPSCHSLLQRSHDATIIKDGWHVVITDEMTGSMRTVAGPKLIFLGAHESVSEKLHKLVL